MKQVKLITLLAAFTIHSYAQQAGTITLQQCFEKAFSNNPLSAQGRLLEESSALQVSVYDKANLPQFSLNAQATYQSAVTELPFHVPGITVPEIPKEQYKASMDVNQLIYGAGISRSQKMLEKVNLDISKTNVETELYKIRDRISQVFLGILLCDNHIKVIENSQSELENRLNKVKAGIRNGVVLPSNESVLRVEMLKAQQRLIEIRSQREAFVGILETLTGMKLDGNESFAPPDFNLPLEATNLRPEYKLFGMQQERALQMKTLTEKRDYPRVFGFGSAGYGRPGLNMFKEEADFFYIVGAKATWNLWNWHQTRQEKAMLDVAAQLVENQKQAYELNVQTQLMQQISDIRKLEKLIESDDEIVKLRQSITQTAVSQLDNGTLTASEYLTEYNAELAATLQSGIHKIQLLQAKAAYLAVCGSL